MISDTVKGDLRKRARQVVPLGWGGVRWGLLWQRSDGGPLWRLGAGAAGFVDKVVDEGAP